MNQELISLRLREMNFASDFVRYFKYYKLRLIREVWKLEYDPFTWLFQIYCILLLMIASVCLKIGWKYFRRKPKYVTRRK